MNDAESHDGCGQTQVSVDPEEGGDLQLNRASIHPAREKNLYKNEEKKDANIQETKVLDEAMNNVTLQEDGTLPSLEKVVSATERVVPIDALKNIDGALSKRLLEEYLTQEDTHLVDCIEECVVEQWIVRQEDYKVTTNNYRCSKTKSLGFTRITIFHRHHLRLFSCQQSPWNQCNLQRDHGHL